MRGFMVVMGFLAAICVGLWLIGSSFLESLRMQTELAQWQAVGEVAKTGSTLASGMNGILLLLGLAVVVMMGLNAWLVLTIVRERKGVGGQADGRSLRGARGGQRRIREPERGAGRFGAGRYQEQLPMSRRDWIEEMYRLEMEDQLAERVLDMRERRSGRVLGPGGRGGGRDEY